MEGLKLTSNENLTNKDKKKLREFKNTRLKLYENTDFPKQTYTYFKKRKVKVFLTNGENLTGYIVKEWTYEILLVKFDNIKDFQGRPLEKRSIIPKHAILYTANLIHLPESD